MSRLSAIDLTFLVLESQHRPMHMSSCVIFEPPARQKRTFVARVIESFRSSEVGAPFDHKLKWLDDGVARWETAEPDMNYHVKHVAVPAPGTLEQLDELLGLLNPPLLDRTYPLWQCYVIEGLEDGRFALFFKMHHAIIDGEGGMKVFQESLNTNRTARAIKPFWAPAKETPKRPRSRVSQSQFKKFTSQLSALPSGVMDVTSGLVDLGAKALMRKPGTSFISRPFNAPDTPFNVPTLSSARSYANCDLPLDRIKAVARAADCTLNDVVMTIIDHALHQYLGEEGAHAEGALIAAMPVSARIKGEAASGNQVSSDLVTMGQPEATLTERLQQIHESTTKVKTKAQQLSLPMRQLLSLMLLGAATIPDLTPGLTAAPSYNIIISNMAGPRGQFYLGGAALVGIRGMPIVPPNPGLNATFVSFHDQICLAVGCTPESMRDPGRFVKLIQKNFLDLERKLIRSKPAAGKSVRKSAGRKSTPRRKRG